MTQDFPDNPWRQPAVQDAPVNPWVSSSPSHLEDAAPVTGHLNAMDFLAASRQNRRNTLFLMLGMLALAAGFGYLLGWGWDMAMGNLLQTSMSAMQGHFEWGRLFVTKSPMGIMLSLSLLAGMLVWALLALWRADRMVLKMTDAKEVGVDAMPQLHNIVEEMALAVGLPKPRVVLVETETPNAFATGLKTDKAIIGVTSGLLKNLSRRELQGVIAHEMGHILNGDMRYATLVAVMTGVLILVAQIVLNARHFIGYASYRPQRDDRRQSNPLLGIFVLVFAMIAAVLVPIIARLIQMAVSRQREYLADATAVQLTRDPQSMIGALEKIAALQQASINLPQKLEPLYIVTPLEMLQNGNMTWFSTHPPLQKRIERLKGLE